MDQPDRNVPSIRGLALRDFRIALEIAKHGNFRVAARHMEMAPSTLSHALTELERTLGVRLFNRSTRSVALTAEGESLLAEISPHVTALEEIVTASARSTTVAGELRINVPLAAASYLIAEVVPEFAVRHPNIRLELRHEERMVDIVGEGCDAGIRLGRTVPGDMIGVPFGPPLRFIPVASPAYVEANGIPGHPSELLRHRCIRIRMPAGERYAWEFERQGESFVADVDGFLTLDRMALMIEAAISGLGIAYVLEDVVRPHLDALTLVSFLTDWCPADERYMLYYPGRRNVLPQLRAFINVLNQRRRQ